MADAKKVLANASADAATLRQAAQDLQKASYKVAEALYTTAPEPDAAPGGGAGNPAGAGAGSRGAKTDDVIDAEVVEEKK